MSYSVPFNHKGEHCCQGAVVRCMDWRFNEVIKAFVENVLEMEKYDLISIAGAGKTINDEDGLVDFCLKASRGLHEAKKFVIINHADCGAYGGLKKFNGDKRAEEAFHRAALLKAKAILAAKLPDREIIAVYARLNEDDSQVEFMPV